MSEETQEQTSAEDAQLAEIQLDWFLQALVNVLNPNPGASFGITLSVGGMLVSGQLVSGKVYFEAFAKDFANSWRRAAPDEDFTEPEMAITELGRIYDEPLPVDKVEFIHLKNAQFFLSGQPPVPANRKVLWRGRLEAVDGFMLGSLSA